MGRYYTQKLNQVSFFIYKGQKKIIEIPAIEIRVVKRSIEEKSIKKYLERESSWQINVSLKEGTY